jgi:hypothetical protein
MKMVKPSKRSKKSADDPEPVGVGAKKGDEDGAGDDAPAGKPDDPRDDAE